MRTRDDLWGWVWEEGWADPELEADFQAAEEGLEDLDFDLWEEPAGGSASARTAVMTAPPPADEAPAAVASPLPADPVPVSRPLRAPPPAAPRPEPRVRPTRLRRTRRRRLRRAAALLVLVAAGVTAGAWWYLPRPSGPAPEPDPAPAAMPATQHVVTWAVWDDEGDAAPSVAVLAAGGGEEPVVLAVPGNLAVSIPGHGLGTIDDAAAAGDVTVLAATVENILGVQVDDAWGIPLSELGALVADIGSIEVEDRLLDGPAVVDYLAEPAANAAEERVIRWQVVLRGLLGALHQEPSAAGEVPDGVRSALVAGPDEVLAVPVEEVGAGLARLDDAGLARIVATHFVPTGGEEKSRLVVLNGNGRPGVGQQVARLLVPEGFRLVSSQNAVRFDYRVTKIIASSNDDLAAARKARRLLGVGTVLLGNEASGIADVTVVVGEDFGGP